jgi:di/tricarboxylate transporter
VKTSFWRSAPLITICFTGLAFCFAYEFVTGNLLPRQLAIALLLLITALFGFVLFRLRRYKFDGNQTLDADNKSTEMIRAMRTLRILVIILPVILVVGLWLTRGEALGPRLAGSAINILLTLWFLVILRRTRSRGGS